jgi:hypothetical protein
MAWSAPVYVCSATENGLLATAQNWATIKLGPGGRLETVADIDSDGAADLVVRHERGDAEMEIWFSDGLSRFTKKEVDILDWDEIMPEAAVRVVGAANVGLGSWQ